MPASAKPVAYIPCPHCDDLHIKYKNMLEGLPYICNTKPISQDYYQKLFRGTQGMLVAS